MIPSCLRQPNTASSTTTISHSHSPQNVVTCTYQAQLCNNSPTHLTLSWSRTPSSHSLTIHAPHTFSATISLSPPSFLRSPRRGSKSIHSHNIKLHWNFSRAEYVRNSAEPDSRFYFAIICKGKLQFFLGDLLSDLARRRARPVISEAETEAVTLSRREHVFGSKRCVSRAVFMGCKHEIEIECREGNKLRVKVDGQVRLVVKRLCWKFRGNDKLFIDGVGVEFYWDVLSWVVTDGDGDGAGNNGHAVFVFQVGDGNVWPEMVGATEKRLMRKGLLSPLGSGVLQWAEESSDGGGRSSCSSSSTRSCGSNGAGFSLLLYAWNQNN